MLKDDPETARKASIEKDPRYADQLTDRSEKGSLDRLSALRAFLLRVDAIDTTGFPEEERLNQVLLSPHLRLEVEEEVRAVAHAGQPVR